MTAPTTGNGWISMRKRKPKFSESCLVWFASEFEAPGYVRVHVGGKCRGELNAYPHVMGDKVTHWMPLPEPPK